MSLLPTQQRMFDMLLSLSQIVAERGHGKEVVADAIAAAKERFGNSWSLHFLDSGDPYETLLAWHKQTLEKKPSVVPLSRPSP